MSLEQKIEQANNLLTQIERDYAPAVFASSLGAEDMVLTDLIAQHHPGIAIFTLDTGRLPEATHKLLAEVTARYNIEIKVYYPAAAALESLVAARGINGFYDSADNRKACCVARKVEPLARALVGKQAWITGLRREQAVTRAGLELSSFDAANGLQKFNPLLEWSNLDVWTYIRRYKTPYNALHDEGYPSIGCAPCTRAINPGEDVRAGRWWWESADSKECGLHPRKLEVA